MESALITMPPVSSASSSAAADLPLAVGPAIITASKVIASPIAGPSRMTSVPRPGYYRLLSVIGEGAAPADYLPALSEHHEPVILSPGKAFEMLVHHDQWD